ncbi:MAG: hypothetical protein WA144_08850 [Candidatus Methanoperedens sp.]
MIFFNNFQEKIRNILKKIEHGNASESNMTSLCELLDNHQDIIPEAVGVLNDILLKGNVKAFNSAICAYNIMAQNHIAVGHYPADVIVGCMRDRRNDLREDSMLNILEILSKIAQKYPERMKIAVPELLIALESTNTKSREISHFILSILAATHHEFFKDRSKELIRVLNGLNVDERIYAIRLTKQLAEKEPSIVADTYDLLEDLRLNHPDSNLRSEAGFAMDKFKEAVKQEPSKSDTPPVMKTQSPGKGHKIKGKKGRAKNSENLFSGLSELMTPDKEDIIDILDGMNLKHLIVNK